MDPSQLLETLNAVGRGELPAEEALNQLRDLPFRDLGDAKIDQHRALRQGAPEVILGEPKDASLLLRLSQAHLQSHQNLLITRVSPEKAEALLPKLPGAEYDPLGRTLLVLAAPPPPVDVKVGIVSAGSGDGAVVAETATCLRYLGLPPQVFADVGVAGIHRLFAQLPKLQELDVAICAAGMEGALPSVLGGLLACPVIAVPTSVGYGANFQGLSALLGMLNSCAAGLVVVNIDNGFGAAMATLRLSRLVQKGLAVSASKQELLYVDAFSGLAGNMLLGGLLELGVDESWLLSELSKLPVDGYRLRSQRVESSGISARHLEVDIDEGHHHRTYGGIAKMLRASSLPAAAKELALSIFRKLGEAEARVHDKPLDEVHFHEVGSVDAIVDIVGCALGFSHLNRPVICSHLPLGKGFVTAAHGPLPLPAPATLLCLKGVPTYGSGIGSELVTPTGAAIIATVAEAFVDKWPAMTSERIAWSAGKRQLREQPNLLRMVLGSGEQIRARHVLLETNIDDMTAESLAFALERLFDAGALDSWVTPIHMKKGRAGYCLRALTTSHGQASVEAALLTHTTSLGLRALEISRPALARREVQLPTEFGPIRLKVTTRPDGSESAKPEFDDCAAQAQAHGVGVERVRQAALHQWIQAQRG